MQVLFSLSALLMLTLHKTLTHVEPKLFVGSFVVCAIGSCAYLAKNSGMGELDISGKKVLSSPTPSLDSYKLLAHFTQRATHHSHTIYILLATILATAIPIRALRVAKRHNPVRTAATSPYRCRWSVTPTGASAFPSCSTSSATWVARRPC